MNASFWRSRRTRYGDLVGRRLITAAGIGVIVAVLSIFLFIVRETYPLFLPAQAQTRGAFTLAADAHTFAVGVDPYRVVGFAVQDRGVRFFRLPDGVPVEAEGDQIPGRISCAYVSPVDQRLAVALADGRVATGRIIFAMDHTAGERIVHPRLQVHRVAQLAPMGEEIVRLAYREDEAGRSLIAALTGGGRLLVVLRQQHRTLLGTGSVVERSWDLSADLPHPPSALVVGGGGRQLLCGTVAGEVVAWRLSTSDTPPERVQVFTAAARGTAVTALEFLLGEVSVVVGDSQGGVSTWFETREAAAEQPRFRLIHQLRSHAGAVTCVAPSARDKQFATADCRGNVAVHHATSEQTQWTAQLDTVAIGGLAFAPKADGLLALSRRGRITDVALCNPHPEISLGTLFGRIWYEGYDVPEYVWQSSGGTDEFEPKLSLIPLIFGTVKGTLYALLVALPLAVLAAVYTSEFASPQVRRRVKPTVEIMASLPSVILGFLAGLWLAPLLEKHLLSLAAMVLMVPLCLLSGAGLWHSLPRRIQDSLPRSARLMAILGATLTGVLAALGLGPVLERIWLGESFVSWMAADPQWHYDQRNCLVIGLTMGFAVIPLIFTICEDALTSIPQSLRAASLALGASRWQTAVRVVLPMAAPGVFSAAMIGFGRAVGETMIVLMATGNTPIMEWSAFTGMRTIAANIAVEVPEAPQEGTLYRVLFLSGLLLFLSTFVINTLAEIVRQRLRKRYSLL